MYNTEIFLSYCWSDKTIADEIFDSLASYQNITIHRDIIEITHWRNIKTFMQSIEKMDYTILLISDAYLKSRNCMYEVLEVMKDSAYANKIFPAVITNNIYQPIIRAQYVKYWQNEYSQLKTALKEIQTQNLGTLTEDLKHLQNISANIAEFLSKVSELNNPSITDVSEAIIQKLEEQNLIKNNISKKTSPYTTNMEHFAELYEEKSKERITDLEISRYIINAFDEINNIFIAVCKKYEENNKSVNILNEKITSRSYLHTFFKNGISKKRIHIFVNDSFGNLSICISENNSTMTSWNEMYSPEIINNEIKLSGMMDFNKKTPLSIEETVKDIWKRFVTPYI